MAGASTRTSCPASSAAKKAVTELAQQALLGDSPQDKDFVYCRYGEDRTGIFVASYRKAFEKLPPDQALKEMYYFGFNGFWHPSMTSFVREFPVRLASAPALAPFKPKD